MKQDINDPELLLFLKERFSYCPDTGHITHKISCGRALRGARAEFTYSNGYLGVKVLRRGFRHSFLAHRLAWLLHTGNWPEREIDHLSAKNDNRFCMIRDVTRSVNIARRKTKDRVLPRGVCWTRVNKTNPYKIFMEHNGKKIQTYHPTPEAASHAYREAFLNSYGRYPESL